MDKKARSFARLLLNNVGGLCQLRGKRRSRVGHLTRTVTIVAEGITRRTSCGTTTRAATVRMRVVDTVMPF